MCYNCERFIKSDSKRIIILDAMVGRSIPHDVLCKKCLDIEKEKEKKEK